MLVWLVGEMSDIIEVDKEVSKEPTQNRIVLVLVQDIEMVNGTVK